MFIDNIEFQPINKNNYPIVIDKAIHYLNAFLNDHLTIKYLNIRSKELIKINTIKKKTLIKHKCTSNLNYI